LVALELLDNAFVEDCASGFVVKGATYRGAALNATRESAAYVVKLPARVISRTLRTRPLEPWMLDRLTASQSLRYVSL